MYQAVPLQKKNGERLNLESIVHITSVQEEIIIVYLIKKEISLRSVRSQYSFQASLHSKLHSLSFRKLIESFSKHYSIYLAYKGFKLSNLQLVCALRMIQSENVYNGESVFKRKVTVCWRRTSIHRPIYINVSLNVP